MKAQRLFSCWNIATRPFVPHVAPVLACLKWQAWPANRNQPGKGSVSCTGVGWARAGWWFTALSCLFPWCIVFRQLNLRTVCMETWVICWGSVRGLDLQVFSGAICVHGFVTATSSLSAYGSVREVGVWHGCCGCASTQLLETRWCKWWLNFFPIRATVLISHCSSQIMSDAPAGKCCCVPNPGRAWCWLFLLALLLGWCKGRRGVEPLGDLMWWLWLTLINCVMRAAAWFVLPCAPLARDNGKSLIHLCSLV